MRAMLTDVRIVGPRIASGAVSDQGGRSVWVVAGSEHRVVILFTKLRVVHTEKFIVLQNAGGCLYLQVASVVLGVFECGSYESQLTGIYTLKRASFSLAALPLGATEGGLMKLALQLKKRVTSPRLIRN